MLQELARRGHLTIDTDYDGWTLPNGLWDEARITELLTESTDVIVSGTVENQVKFYPSFTHIVLLSAPIETLLSRVSTRTNNDYGHTHEQQAEIRNYVSTVEPLLRIRATMELDGQQPPAALADELERHLAA